ncbi:MAG TPA: SPOR domain-containing protein [Ignavibacteriaceae bacterium]|nr:SPOR domain-containing protein [Ignavibacteriaceae bacterium]
MKRIFFLFAFIQILNFSCSSSKEETRDEEIKDEDETYIFDEIPENEIENTEEENEVISDNIFFLIQIGAFTTKEKAESFADISRNKLGEEISVSYNDEVNLFVVRLDKKFNSKNEAEIVRDELRKMEDYKDAWILSSLK